MTFLPTNAGPSLIHVHHAAPGGLSATYYDSLNNPRVSRIDSTVDFDLATEVAASTLVARKFPLEEATGFSVVWEGFVMPAATGVFFFGVDVRGASGSNHEERVRLTVDDVLLIDYWNAYQPISISHFEATINLRSTTDFIPIRYEGFLFSFKEMYRGFFPSPLMIFLPSFPRPEERRE